MTQFMINRYTINNTSPKKLHQEIYLVVLTNFYYKTTFDLSLNLIFGKNKMFIKNNSL